jgi:hypothetical protein
VVCVVERVLAAHETTSPCRVCGEDHDHLRWCVFAWLKDAVG